MARRNLQSQIYLVIYWKSIKNKLLAPKFGWKSE